MSKTSKYGPTLFFRAVSRNFSPAEDELSPAGDTPARFITTRTSGASDLIAFEVAIKYSAYFSGVSFHPVSASFMTSHALTEFLYFLALALTSLLCFSISFG